MRYCVEILLAIVALLVFTSAEQVVDNSDVLERLASLERNQELLKRGQDQCNRELASLRQSLTEQASVTITVAASLERLQSSGTNRSTNQAPGPVRRQAVHTDAVAFTAYVDNDVGHMGIEQIIPYNRIVTNVGGAFNINTHTFLCPVSGLYFFSFIVSEIGDRELVAKLVIDGQNVVDAIANPVRGDHDQQGGNMAVLRVQKGQSLWVVNYFQNDVYLRSDESYRFASFSGVLLRADEI